jgi:hypothetical protein
VYRGAAWAVLQAAEAHSSSVARRGDKKCMDFIGAGQIQQVIISGEKAVAGATAEGVAVTNG